MSRAATIAVLRQSMARIEAGNEEIASGLSASTGFSAAAGIPASTGLPVPNGLERVLPSGLAVGTAHTCASAGAVVAGIVAEVTTSGKHVAVVGLPDFGLLPVVEQGGDLARIVCVDEPGANPLETIGLLIDGFDLVVAHLPQAPGPSLARPIMARLRKAQGALLFIGEDWPGAKTHITSELAAVSGVGCGRGRVRGVQYRVRATAKGMPERSVLWSVGDYRENRPESSAVVSLARRREANGQG